MSRRSRGHLAAQIARANARVAWYLLRARALPGRSLLVSPTALVLCRNRFREALRVDGLVDRWLTGSRRS